MTETSYSHIVLTWTKPEDRPGIQDEAKGYFVEIRQAECMEWSRCNTTPVITTSYSVKGLRSMDMYWLRVIAINDGGESAPEELPNYVTAMPSPGTSPRIKFNCQSFFTILCSSYYLSFMKVIRIMLKANANVFKVLTLYNEMHMFWKLLDSLFHYLKRSHHFVHYSSEAQVHQPQHEEFQGGEGRKLCQDHSQL